MNAQSWNPERYRKHGAFVPALGREVVDLLAPRPGEKILDLGCGDGVLSAEIAACGAVVCAVDASPEQIAAAKALGLRARVEDARSLEERDSYDAVFSNAALHWIPEAAEVAQRVFRALRDGGRFVGEFGGAGNLQTVLQALLAELGERGIDGSHAWPWYFPSALEYRNVLENAGFCDIHTELFDRPTQLPGRLADWIETFAQDLLDLVPEAQRSDLIDDVERRAASLRDSANCWCVDYVRLRFHARCPIRST